MSPTIAGSRPGGLIAGAWAAMMSLGQEGVSIWFPLLLILIFINLYFLTDHCFLISLRVLGEH